MSIQSRIDSCYRSIEANNREIRRYEELIASISRFQGTVSSTQSDFERVNSAKKALVTGLKEYERECQSAKTYVEGMENVLEGIGTLYVKGTLNILQSSIDSKITSYRRRIESLEDSIDDYYSEISYLESLLESEDED